MNAYVFFLEKAGISYEWDTELVRDKFSSVDWHRLLNRIFLSKLRIDVEGTGKKEIALWMPVQFTDSELYGSFPIRSGRTSFSLWKTDGKGKEFVVSPELDNVWLFLDFDQCVQEKDTFTVDKSQPPQKVPQSLAYVPIIQGIPPAVRYGLVQDTSSDGQKLMSMLIDFKSESDDRKNIESQIQKEIETIKSIDRPKITREIRDLQAEVTRWSNNTFTSADQQRFQNNSANVQAAITNNNNRITELQKKIEDSKEASREIRKLNTRLNRLSDPWRSARIDVFSIDLVKKDTSADKVAQPENRLPLFRVVKDPNWTRPTEVQKEQDTSENLDDDSEEDATE